MAEREDHPNALRRLRDFTGEIVRPFRGPSEEDLALLGDDGHLDHAEQLKILTQLLPAQNRRSVGRFTLMQALSVTIAVMGLALDSAAVVIGAMLIAPLMTPIITFSAAVGLGLGRRAVQAAFLVVAGAVGSIGFAWLLAWLLPSVEIGSEVLSRTAPDVRDLIVAVAAGAAGAYATAREDVSGALPGVAVAVALVPPLAATGVLLEADLLVLAEGSALLFLTNLLAIIVSALIVLLATGVIPTVKLAFKSARIALTTLGIVVATALIAIPLTARSLEAADASQQNSEVAETVDDWIGDLQLTRVRLDVDGTVVTVELTGLDEPPRTIDLAENLVPILGPDAEVVVLWDQRAQGRARAGVDPPPEPEVVARTVIDGWAASLVDRDIVLEVLDVTVDDGRVEVVVGGPVAPPSTPTLSDEVAAALGTDVDLAIRWIQTVASTATGELPEVALERIVTAWIGPRASVRLIGASIDGTVVRIDLGADGRPLGVTTLRRVVLDTIEGATTVEVRLLPLTLIDSSPDLFEPPDVD